MIRTRTKAERKEKTARTAALREGRRQLDVLAGRTPPAPPPPAERPRLLPAVPDLPLQVVSVSTARRPGTERERLPDILLPAFIDWMRRQPCAFGCGRAAVEPHHYPTKGAMGRTVDALAAATCRPCHDRAHTAVAHGGFPAQVQAAAVWETWRRLLDDPPALREVICELAASMR